MVFKESLLPKFWVVVIGYDKVGFIKVAEFHRECGFEDEHCGIEGLFFPFFRYTSLSSIDIVGPLPDSFSFWVGCLNS